jgi:hypothetical protein
MVYGSFIIQLLFDIISTAHITWSRVRICRLFTVDESGSMRKEAVMAIVWTFLRSLSEGTEGNHNGLNHDNRKQIEGKAEFLSTHLPTLLIEY